MDFLVILLGVLLIIGLITFIVLKIKESSKAVFAFYAVLTFYVGIFVVFGFYPYEGFASGSTVFLFYMVLFVFSVLIGKLVKKPQDFHMWFWIYNALFLMHLIADMFELTHSIFDDMTISSIFYLVLNYILIIISLINREKLGILIANITGGVFIALNTISIVGTSESVGEAIFLLILFYLLVALVGAITFLLIKKRILNDSPTEESRENNKSIAGNLEDII